MDKSKEQLEVKALERPVQLGQLYDATTSSFRNEFLFNREKASATVRTIAMKSTDFEYKEVRSLQDRAHTLQISASLSVSILCGAIAMGGYGSYLDRSKDSSQSTTVAAVVRIRTEYQYLDVHGLHDAIRLDEDDFEYIGATHVITGITYGGNAIGSITEKMVAADSQREVQGSFNIGAFKKMAKLFSVQGKAELSDEQKSMIDNYNVNVKYMADFKFNDPLPTRPTELIDLIKKSPELIGSRGVPCDIILTPLNRFNKINVVTKFRELDDSDLKMITDFYDQLVDLQVNRRYILDQLEENYKLFFPTLLAECRKRKTQVDKLASHTRSALRRFLETYRSDSDGEDNDRTVDDFIKGHESAFETEHHLYERDWTMFEDLLERKRAADEHQFKLINVSTLRTEMNRPDGATIALVLIPPIVGTIALFNMYRLYAGVVRQWQADKPTKKDDGSTVPAVYYSLYLDSLVVDDVKKLDDKQTLQTAIEGTQTAREAAFVTFGISRSGGYVRELRWEILGQEGWGVLVNREEGWRYIGEVQGGLPHGVGTMAYCDGTTYGGDWIQGKRDGRGRLTRTAATEGTESEVLAEGVFIENRLQRDGIVVEARAYKNHSIVDYAPMALRTGDAVSSHIAKVAKVFGFRVGQKYEIRLSTLAGDSTVLADGNLIDPTEAPGVGATFWPLEATGEKQIVIDRRDVVRMS
ncbi:hypothetical protein APHAL10511_008464 [Amanita phalloides]|nr:hypothetical protein APHAL10511_008464 [Amanita phalloides]